MADTGLRDMAVNGRIYYFRVTYFYFVRSICAPEHICSIYARWVLINNESAEGENRNITQQGYTWDNNYIYKIHILR